MTSEVKNLTNKLAAQFSPHGDKDAGVPSKSTTNSGAFLFPLAFWDTTVK